MIVCTRLFCRLAPGTTRTRTFLIKRQPRWYWPISGCPTVLAHLTLILLLGRLWLPFELSAAAVAQNLRRLTKLVVRPSPAACTRKVELKHSIRPSRFGLGVSLKALTPGGEIRKSVPSNRGPPCTKNKSWMILRGQIGWTREGTNLLP